MARLAATLTLAALVALPATAGAVQGPTLPANDFEALLTLTGGQFVGPSGPLQTISSGAPTVPPRADCNAGSDPLPGLQGRVSPEDIASPGAEDGWRCNLTVVGHSPTPGRFRTWRYEDRSGHVCAFYDSSLPAPANALSAGLGPSLGVVVLDMADPAHPVETMRLTSPAMLSPHESLNLNPARGLLGAEVGNGLTRPGQFDIYEVGQDCRRPVLQATMPTVFGHESGFTRDGKTFWVAGGGGKVLAVDVTNPKMPYVVWTGNMYAHGLNLSDDGNTLYQTDPINGNLGILDVSQVQARKPDPQVRELSRSTWDSVSIPQNSEPLTIDGHPYLLEFDEFAFRFNPVTVEDLVGGARLVDIADPRHPKHVSDLRLEVNSKENHQAYNSDPGGGFSGPTFVYSAHYCAAAREVDPEIVACSFMNSGLRVFDVRDPAHPREVAYYIAPPKAGDGVRIEDGNVAFSKPSFDPARREVWYTDAVSGFYALRLDPAVWPNPVGAGGVKGERRACTRGRTVRIRVRPRRGERIRRIVATVHGKRVGLRRGSALRSIRIGHLRPGMQRIRLRLVTNRGIRSRVVRRRVTC